jgi:hypothetical protein
VTISFKVSLTDDALIRKIAARAAKHLPVGALETSMDLAAVHANDIRLDLAELLAAPAFDFSHDIMGIRKNLNRDTGILMNCFLPRCAQAEKEDL